MQCFANPFTVKLFTEIMNREMVFPFIWRRIIVTACLGIRLKCLQNHFISNNNQPNFISVKIIETNGSKAENAASKHFLL